MNIIDRIRTAVSPVARQSASVPITLDRPLPTSIGNFTQNLTGLGKAGPHAVRPYITDLGPRPNPRVQLSGLLIPPRIRRGIPTGIGAAHLTRAQVRKSV